MKIYLVHYYQLILKVKRCKIIIIILIGGKPVKTKTISINDIMPGMKTYGDVFNDSGLLIYNSGFVLKESSIAKLALYGVKSIVVEIPDNINYTGSGVETVSESEYAKRVRKKPEFKQFVEVYEQNKQKTVDGINGVADGKNVERDELIEISDEVTTNIKTNSDLFDFLNNIPIDDVTYTHSLNVSIIAKTFGRWIGWSQDKIDDLGVAGLLHDVGKTQVPKEILDKPGKLTDEEYAEIKKHPVYSYRLAQKLNVSEQVLKGILMHHERYDGSGYPMGAKGNQIHLFARVLAIADVFEAMTATRAYRSKICPFKVLDILEFDSYRVFDPAIITKILQNIANSYIGKSVKLNTGQSGKIIFINRRVARPIIEVNGSMFDLSKEDEDTIYIEEVI